MRITKKIIVAGCICLIMLLVIPITSLELFGGIAFTYAEENVKITDDGFMYRYFDETEDTIEIVGYSGDENKITIPGDIESKPVLNIADKAFYCNEDIEEVVFTGNVEGIGVKAFYSCYSLKSVDLCDSIDWIGEQAFAYCDCLTDIVLTENMLEIGESSFVGTGITEIHIPERVSIIWDNAFAWCEKLVSISVSENNREYSSFDGVLYNKNQTQLICCPGGKNNVEIPEGVLQINERAFCGSSIDSIFLPESVSMIGNEAFSGTEMTQFLIPKNVSVIGDEVFYGCNELVNIEVNVDNKFYSSENGILYNKQKTKLVCCPSKQTKVDIPNSVTDIAMYAFGGCEYLTTIIIPNGVTTIGEGAFAWDENISYIYIPDSVVIIGRAAFDLSDNSIFECNENSYAEEYAKEYNINYTIHEHSIVKDDVFLSTCTVDGKTEGEHCSICMEVLIEQDVIPATGHQHTERRDIKTATCKEDGYTGDIYCVKCNEKIGNGVSVAKLNSHNWDDGKITTYASIGKEGVKTYTCSVCAITKIEKIAALAPGASVTPVKGTVLVDNVTGAKYKVLSYSAFSKTVEFVGLTNANVMKVNVPATVTLSGDIYRVTAIANHAFKNNKMLTEVVIGSNVTKIGANAFSSCKKLKNVVIGKKVKSIGEKAFYRCKNLKNITIKTTNLKANKVGKKAFTGTKSKIKIRVAKKKILEYKKLFKAKGISLSAIYIKL